MFLSLLFGVCRCALLGFQADATNAQCDTESEFPEFKPADLRS